MRTLKHELERARKILDKNFDRYLPETTLPENRVTQAMRYSTISGGKAFRAFLVLEVGRLLHLHPSVANQIATALEMVHSYSLIHDDLPAMDNDTMRRGKPTNHIAFDEATAILAGDGLLTLAFLVLSTPNKHLPTKTQCQLINLLAKYAGKDGMVGGQMLDLIGENKSLTLSEIERLQSGKTGALLHFAITAPAVAAGVNKSTLNKLGQFAHDIGLMFQISDDILDVVGDARKMGKTLGKDKTESKSTFVSLLGLQQAKEKSEKLKISAIKTLSSIPGNTDLLQQATEFILTRTH